MSLFSSSPLAAEPNIPVFAFMAPEMSGLYAGVPGWYWPGGRLIDVRPFFRSLPSCSLLLGKEIMEDDVAESFMKSPACSLLEQNNTPYVDQTNFEDIVTINVAGKRFQTFRGTLERFPVSLLGSPKRRSAFYNPRNGEYFFDRHRKSFDAILHFYQSNGVLRRPRNVAVDTFVNEIIFFDLGAETIDKFWRQEGYSKPEAPPMPDRSWQRKLWLLFEHPDSSIAARILGLFSLFVILLSTVTFCLETLPSIREKRKGEWENVVVVTLNMDDPFVAIEVGCIVWFTLEFVMRLLSSPSKVLFCKSILNWIDFIAIAPFYINIAFSGNADMPFAVLRVLRLFRVFRIFKLSRHSRGLRILFETFKASVRELCLLIFLVLIAMVLFSSVIYYAEEFHFSHIAPNSTDVNQFTSIPLGFWYTLVTMTTVGYGDITPKGALGRVVGMVCALIGVLVIALPVPVIVENFKHFYRQERRIAIMINVRQDLKDHDPNAEPHSFSTASL